VGLLPTNSVLLARARTYYKFLNPCHRCHLAKLFEYQWIAGDNEVATVTRKGDFAAKMGSFRFKKEVSISQKGVIIPQKEKKVFVTIL